jgi:hypothetical protein
VFLLDNTALRTQITDLVERICQDYDLPVPTLRQLCDRIQNHLLDDLDNLPLSVVLSRVPYRPVGWRQAVYLTQSAENEIRLDDLPSGEVRAEAITETAQIEEATYEDHEAMMAIYDQLLKEIDDDLQALFEMKRPKKRIEVVEAWIADHKKEASIPTHNLIWLLRYVISLVGDRKKSPHTRGVYWYALRRVWTTF